MNTALDNNERQKGATAHTPGPWAIEPGGGHAHARIVGSDSVHTNGRQRNSAGISSASYSDTVCEIPHDLNLPGPAANARLIAAAPDLLAALERIEPGPDYIDDGQHGGGGFVACEISWDDLRIIRAAIAKATV